MLSKLKVQHYKSLFDTEIDLERLTVFIGPNGSGKSNICESLVVLSDFIKRLVDDFENKPVKEFLSQSLNVLSKNQSDIESKFWQSRLDHISFMIGNPKCTDYIPEPLQLSIILLIISIEILLCG